MKGCSLEYLHKEYPGTHALSSGRVEPLYTLRCINTIRLAGGEGRIHHRLGNEGVVKKYRHIGRGFRAATTTDGDLWKAMSVYMNEWRDETTVS